MEALKRLERAGWHFATDGGRGLNGLVRKEEAHAKTQRRQEESFFFAS